MTSVQQQLLPRLNDAELESLFRHDERAIWRYHVLEALLLEGGAVAEVARTFDTTAETVRTLRASFLASGHLDTLRSKRRGAAGHLTRQTPLAQAVARELAADPTATGGTIWRRVREQLADGAVVPRRSIYRLVERLRPQPSEDTPADALWAPALMPVLRTALPLLTLDPPLDLGRSALAERVLPDLPDPLGRGLRLRELLERALATMEPGAGDDPQDIAFRPAQVLIGEAIGGKTREELQQSLAIAPATYSRAKRLGLERLAELLVGELRREHPTPQHAVPPAAPPLLGRARELAYYARRLNDEGLAVLWGLPGSGKAALAANLAELVGADNVIWHSCAGAGDDILRQLLRSYGEAQPGATDTSALLDRVREQTRRGGLLVLVGFERIADDSVADLLIATLRNTTERALVRLLVVSRALPTWAERQGWLPLSGLPDGLARLLWSGVGGGALGPAAWARIYHQSLGYPGLLHALATQPTTFVSYLRDQLYAGLSPRAALLLNELLLGAQPGPPEADTDAAETSLALPELERRALATRAPGHWMLHPLVRSHRHQLAELIEGAAQLHQQLALRARAEERWLDAATHDLAAGNTVAAVRLVGMHVDAIVASHAGRTAIELLNKLLLRLKPGPALAEVKAYLGTLYLALGDYHAAVEALRTALDLSAGFLDDTAAHDVRCWHRLIAEAYLWMGQWRSALAHTQTSMGGTRTISPDVAPLERISLTLLQQRIWWLLGEPEQARYWAAEAKMQAQASACPTSSALVAYADGVAAARAGAPALAVERLGRALAQLPPDAYHNERYAISALLARCLVAAGQGAAADALLQTQLQHAEMLHHASGMVALMLARLEWAVWSGNLELAELIALRAETLHAPTHTLLGVELRLAGVWIALGRHAVEQAAEDLLGIQIVAGELELVEIQAKADLLLAWTMLQGGDSSSAALYAARAAGSAAKADAARLRALANLYLAHEAVLRGEPAEAAAALAAAELPSDPAIQAQRAVYRGALDAASPPFVAPLALTPALLV